jgi:hypothetical protein
MTDQNPTQPFEAPQPEPGVPAQPAPDAAQPTPPAAPDPAWSQPAPVAPPATVAPAPAWSQPASPPPPSAPPTEPLPPPAAPSPYAPPPPYAPPAPPPAQPSYAGQPPESPASPYAPPAAAPWVAAGQPPVAPAPAWAPPTDPFGAAVPPTGFDVPIAPVASKPKGRNPIRWVAALLVVALVVVAGLGATLLLTSSTSGTSAVLGYVPADSILYAEARLDLPGNQRAEVAKTLSAFPGFADQAALNTKMGEVFDKILKAATKDKHDYQTEIAPWFGGQIAVAEGPGGLSSSLVYPSQSPAPSPTISPTASLPACTGLPVATPSPSPSDDTGNYAYPVGSMNIRALVLANVTDPKKAGAWVDSILTDAKTTTTDATCDGVAVHIVSTPSSGFLDTPAMGWAILGDKVLVAGDLDSIRLAIATKGTGGLSTTANFQKAVGALKGDHVSFVYEALRATYSAQVDSLKAADTDGTATAALNVLAGMVPEWVAFDLRAADGNFVSETVEPASDIYPTTNRASDLAAVAPATTIAMLDSHDLGKVLTAIRGKFAAEPKLAKYVKQLDDALGLAGGWDSTIGWIGDAGFAVTRDGNSISGGLLIRPEDSAAAKHLFTQIRSLAALSGATSGVSITDDTYKGATLTTVDLSSLAPALGSSMGGGLGGMSIPSDLKLVYAVTDKVVLMTLDTNFAKAVIDASQGGDSLAKNARFAALLSKSGDKGTSFIWVDLTATRELIENQLPADSRSKYDSDIRPYLLPLDALMSTGVYDNGLNRSTTILSIKH